MKDNFQSVEIGEKLGEECGVFGIFDPKGGEVAKKVYYALFALQHRGQASCGMAVNNDGLIYCHKDAGLVGDVFTKDVLKTMGEGKIAIGHVRYASKPENARQDAQPYAINHVKGGMAICNNGSLVNGAELREELELKGSIFHTFTNTEVISTVITQERLTAGSIEKAVSQTMNRLVGSYCLLCMSAKKLIACRDPHGFHPLCIGKLDDSYIVTSESCALDNIGATFVRDVKPGEIIIIDDNGLRSDETHCKDCETKMCIFEYIYFARPDSTLDGCSVHMARRRAGQYLAKDHPVDADVVIGVPDSGLDAAIGYAMESGIPYGIGFLKNKYIGRTFIQPTQTDREDKVRIKLNVIRSVVEGKRVVMVDDSIVRGTTCARIVNLLREAGATEVHMRSSAPAFLHPCYYGTDIDSEDKLIAHKHTIEEIRDILNVDSLGYLSTEHIKDLAYETNMGFCDACFTGNYPTELPKPIKKPIYMVKLSEKQ